MIIRGEYVLILVLFGLIGCSKQELSPEPSLNSLHNVGYELNRSGELNLEREYIDAEGNRSVLTTEVSPVVSNYEKIKSAPYEKIPKFEGSYQKNLQFKQNKAIEKKISISGGKVKVTVEDIPVPQFIDLLFAKVLKLNYTVNKDVKALENTITLNISSPQPKQQVFDVVKEILIQEGIKVVKENGTFFLSKTGKSSSIGMSSYIGYGRKVNDNIANSKDIIQFIPYYYINPRRAVTVLQQSGLSKLKFYYPINGIQMLKGKAEDIRKALQLIELFDRPFLEGKTSYIVECDYIDVSKFTKRIKEIFKVHGINVSGSAGSGGILISEIPELNSALVITPKQSWLDMLIYWKNKLDIKSELGFQEPKLYMYKVKHRKAEELAEAINNLLSITTNKGEENTSPKKDQLVKKTSKSQKNSRGSIIPDMHTNTLMMKLLPSEYTALLPFIEKLDAYPLQVMVEVTVAEVTLTDKFSLGFEYALKNNAALVGATGNVLSDAVTALLSRDKGITTTYTAKNLAAIIDAFAQKKLLDIVSKPKMVILNNETGSINVGQQIPVVKSENSVADLGSSSSSTTPSILRNISYTSTGITVNLTPTINSDGILTMAVNLTLSEAQTNDTSSIDSPLIVNRSLSTNIVMKSGDNVLLGGLISTNNSETKGGVPFLKDIPILGYMFKGKSNTKTRTELIMLIRPTIVKTSNQLLNYTQKYQLLLKAVKKI